MIPQEPFLRSTAELQGYFFPRPEELLNGRYKVVRLLGYGRFSSVTLVTDTRQVPMVFRHSLSHASL